MLGDTRRRGMALIVTLIISGLLLMMIMALFQMLRGNGFMSQNYHDEVSALYVAEAGAYDAMVQFNLNPDWVAGFNRVAMPSGRGTYSITFNTSGSGFQKHESVNNLAGDAAADGPRGPGTVPAHSALLVVTANVGSVERQLEVLLMGESSLGVTHPLMASRRIEMEGGVSINGIKALDDDSDVPAGIHSNSPGVTGQPTISWAPIDANDMAVVTGNVSTPDNSATAIDFGSDPSRYNVGAFSPGASQEGFPNIQDISNQVSSHSGDPTLAITSGTTVVGGGDHYLAGPTTINGDLQLNDSTLYVQGDLTVEGAITGNGSVIVDGKTVFRGDSEVKAASKAALFSSGPVELVGYDGIEYIENLAATDPNVQTYWTDLTTTHADMVTLVDQHMQAGTMNSIMGNLGTLDSFRRVFGQASGATYQNRTNNTLGKLVNKLQGQPQSSTRDFLVSKLSAYHQIFIPYGEFDVMNDNYQVSKVPEMMNRVNAISYERLGSSYFQGVVYTNGYLYASHDVTVLGAVLAEDNGSWSKGATDPYEAGDLVLLDGTAVTYIEDFFSDDDDALSGGFGGVWLKTWAGR